MGGGFGKRFSADAFGGVVVRGWLNPVRGDLFIAARPTLISLFVFQRRGCRCRAAERQKDNVGGSDGL